MLFGNTPYHQLHCSEDGGMDNNGNQGESDHINLQIAETEQSDKYLELQEREAVLHNTQKGGKGGYGR